MAGAAVDLHAELSFAHRLADLAAAVTLPRFGGRLDATRKADATAVTASDVDAEAAIRDAIAEAYPADGVCGEEGGTTPGTSGRIWIVDPIDGTVHYADGVPLWTTLIGLRVDGRATLGVADAPALGMRCHAVAGGGAWRRDGRIRTSEVRSLADAFVVHSPIEGWAASGRLDDLARLAAAARRTRGLSDAWAHLLVAQGSAEVLVEHEPCFEWDWTATQVIVEEAGGRVTTLDGAPPTPGQGLLVSNGTVHDEALATLRGGGGGTAASAGARAVRGGSSTPTGPPRR
jgi:histidinol-phosphatase